MVGMEDVAQSSQCRGSYWTCKAVEWGKDFPVPCMTFTVWTQLPLYLFCIFFTVHQNIISLQSIDFSQIILRSENTMGNLLLPGIGYTRPR